MLVHISLLYKLGLSLLTKNRGSSNHKAVAESDAKINQCFRMVSLKI